MELRRNDFEGIKKLAEIWKTTPGAELEASMKGLDITSWQDIILHLRNLGMRENPQIVKLNISLSSDIRITLEGAGVIQAFCQDNRLSDKPFVAMLKENIVEATPVDISWYDSRVKLKREIPLAPDDVRVKEALARWEQLNKHYRNIQRFEFVAPNGLAMRFDISVVRESDPKRKARTFQEAQVVSQPTRYEAEVEITASRDSTTPDEVGKLLIKGMSWLAQGRQRSYILITRQASDYVLGSLRTIFGMKGFKYPGPQPATLERANIDVIQEPGVPNLRTGSYNVTDKADGLRTLLFVSDNGMIFLVDGGGRVYPTGKKGDPKRAGTVLDGEWIRRDKKDRVVSHYYAFDIMALNGDTGVTRLPFMIPGTMFGSSVETRKSVMESVVGTLGGAVQTVRGIPASQDIQFGVKTFLTTAGTGVEIFRECAATVLENAKSAPYNTDGLIFTPNAAPLPIGRASWDKQLKWKPPHENTIDFLVVIDRERVNGKPTAVDAVGMKYRDDAGTTVRHKTLRLFVGGRRDAAFADPRSTVLGDMPLPESLDLGEYREVEFRPTMPRDPMAGICYVAIGEGGNDPAGATAAATALDADTDSIRTSRGDIIQSNMIVEMAYHPELSPGWRWEPVRIRHDKTERWAQGKKGGTMNADWVADLIWSSIHNPVTEDMIRTGQIVECAAPMAVVAPTTYYNRKAPARDLAKVQCLRNFHNDYIKREILLNKTLQAGNSLCDLGMGKAGDLHKWISAGVGYVFGCDYAADNINNPEDGAYQRLLGKMIQMGGRDRVPPMVFVQADAARPLVTGDAGITPEDRDLLVREFSTRTGSFDVTSCMFALHYMFRDESTLGGFLVNLADTIKVGGYFVGCCSDGDAIARLLVHEPTVVGRDGTTDVWMMTRRYGESIGNSVPPSAAGLGLAVDVDFISIGETHTEYLISWEYLVTRLAEVGLELLTPEEYGAMGLTASSQMFGDAWNSSTRKYEMTDAVKRFSFTNRWFIFKRRTNARPLPPVSVMIAPPSVTEVGEVAEVAEVLPVNRIDFEEPVEVQESRKFFIDASVRDPDPRLGSDLGDWPWYMHTGTLVELADAVDISIKYPSVEAAVASAKYQRATNKPELGPKFFRVEGSVHQEFEKLRAKKPDLIEMRRLLEKQTEQTRSISTKAKMKQFKATWDQGTWDVEKEKVYRAYLAERYRVDERFKRMIDGIAAKQGEILYVNGTDFNTLGVGVRADGSLAGGENLIGKWMMELAGSQTM